MLQFETSSEDLTDINGRKGIISSDNTPVTYTRYRLHRCVLDKTAYSNYNWWATNIISKGTPITLIDCHFPIIQCCIYGDYLYTLREYVKIEGIDYDNGDYYESSERLAADNAILANEIRNSISAQDCELDYGSKVSYIDSFTYMFQESSRWAFDELSLQQYQNEIRNFNHFDPEKSVELYQSLHHKKNEQEVFEKLTLSHQKLVFYIAKRYQNKGLLLNDLISAGNLGLMQNIRRYDETTGVDDGVYLSYSIKAAIQKLINDYGGIIHCPSNIRTNYSKIQKAISKCQYELGDDLPNGIISDMTDIPETAVKDTIEMTRDYVSIDFISDCLNNFDLTDAFINSAISDAPLDSMILPCEYPNGQDDEAHLQSLVQLALKELNDNERNVITMYFGLDREREAMNIYEISEIIGLTRERVRQIKESARKKLKKSKLLRRYNLDFVP